MDSWKARQYDEAVIGQLRDQRNRAVRALASLFDVKYKSPPIGVQAYRAKQLLNEPWAQEVLDAD